MSEVLELGRNLAYAGAIMFVPLVLIGVVLFLKAPDKGDSHTIRRENLAKVIGLSGAASFLFTIITAIAHFGWGVYLAIPVRGDFKTIAGAGAIVAGCLGYIAAGQYVREDSTLGEVARNTLLVFSALSFGAFAVLTVSTICAFLAQ